jgi:predicted Holliday junction resolvase-like endonuclease
MNNKMGKGRRGRGRIIMTKIEILESDIKLLKKGLSMAFKYINTLNQLHKQCINRQLNQLQEDKKEKLESIEEKNLNICEGNIKKSKLSKRGASFLPLVGLLIVGTILGIPF